MHTYSQRKRKLIARPKKISANESTRFERIVQIKVLITGKAISAGQNERLHVRRAAENGGELAHHFTGVCVVDKSAFGRANVALESESLVVVGESVRRGGHSAVLAIIWAWRGALFRVDEQQIAIKRHAHVQKHIPSGAVVVSA